MSTSRREFLRAGSVFALAAGLSLSFADVAMGQKRRKPQVVDQNPVVPQLAQRTPLFRMTRETFAPYVNTTFTLDPGHTFPITITLIAVKDLRSELELKQNLPGRECFSLTFRAPEEDLPRQGTYRMRHDALGTFDLFVVPMTDSEGQRFFEAIINRL